MRKYIVVNKDIVLKRGESDFYKKITSLVPPGYRYEWAFNSPELLVVNVMQDSSPEITPTLLEKDKEAVNMKKRAKEKKEYYRMEM